MIKLSLIKSSQIIMKADKAKTSKLNTNLAPLDDPVLLVVFPVVPFPPPVVVPPVEVHEAGQVFLATQSSQTPDARILPILHRVHAFPSVPSQLVLTHLSATK